MKFIIKFLTIPSLILLIMLFIASVHNLKLMKGKKNEQVYNTKPNLIVNYDVFDLEKHDVGKDCPPKTYLKNFKIENVNSNLQYSYICQESKAIGEEFYESSTPINLTDNNKKYKSVNFLDRHEIICPVNHVLQRFKLNKYGDKINYVYRCVKANCNEKIEKESVNEVSVGNFDLKNIQDLKFKIEENQAIIGFKLIVNYRTLGSIFKYSIQVCNLGSDPLKSSNSSTKTTGLEQTSSVEYGDGSIFLLQKLDVKCPNGSVLISLGLNTPESENVNYAYNCKLSNAVKENSSNEKISQEIKIEKGNFQVIKKLSQLNVQCDEGYALQKFKLDSNQDANANKTLFYRYTCVQVNCGRQKSYSTQEMSVGDNSLIFIKNQSIVLQGLKVLTGFRLNTFNNETSENFVYEYNFCEINELPNKPNNLNLPDKNQNKIILNSGEICFDFSKDKEDKNCGNGLVCKYENQNITTVKKCLPTTPLEKGNIFCKTNCVINDNSEIKNCWDGDVKSCKKCTLKQEIIHSEKLEICQAICNANLPNEQCRFYGYINKEKKNFDSNILIKHGLEIVRRIK